MQFGQKGIKLMTKSQAISKLDKIIQLLWDIRDGTQKEQNIVSNICDLACDHKEKTYQAKEPENNVQENYFCENCGKDFLYELE